MRAVLALALAATLISPAAAAHRKPRNVSVPVFIEGVGTVWISARPPRRR